MKFGLKETTIAAICAIFSKFPEIEEAILYGSRAKGNYRTGSDIDLTLKGEKLNHQLTNAIENQIDDLLLPYMFDISIFYEIDNPDLVGYIQRVGKIFYRKNDGN